MNENERVFRRLVKRSRSSLRPPLTDLRAAYDHFGIPHGDSPTTAELARVLTDRIAVVLRAPGDAKPLPLSDIERHLVMRRVADDEPILECIALMARLRDATRSLGWEARPLSDTKPWLEALGFARDQIIVLGWSLEGAPFMNPRVVAVAAAVRTVRKHGFRVAIVNGTASLTPTEDARVANEIDRRVHALGGIPFAEAIFQHIRPTYDPEQQRHHLVRDTATTPRLQPDSLPVGYLLHLAMKHSDASCTVVDPANAFAALLELATAYVRTLDVQPAGSFDVMFKSHSTVLRFLCEIAVFDSACTIVQFRPLDVGRVLRGCLRWLDDTAARAALGWTIEEAVTTATAVLAAVEGARGPGVVSERDIQERAANVPAAAVRSILSVYAHEPHEVNRDFLLPHDQTKATFSFKPLIRLGSDFFIADPSWCAPAFYEAIVGHMRAVLGSKTDRKIGTAIEQLVREELRRHGVAVVSGEYVVDGLKGECDALVETRDAIIIIEMKKKALTRAARSGNDFELLVDVAKTLLDAQIQSARLELLLYQHDAIAIDDGGATHLIERRGRKVERIALTHLDFGALQDRLVIGQVLRLLAGASLQTSDGQNAAVVADLEKTSRELLRVHADLARLRVVNPHDWFFNCWFLCLGHLLVMLDNVTSADDLKRELFLTRSVTMGSLDFYFEYSQGRALRGQADRWGAPAESVLITAPPRARG